MPKVLTVARREFLAMVRTRAFLITVVLMPGLMIAAVGGHEWIETMSRREAIPERRLAVVDRTGALHDFLNERLEAYNAEREHQRLRFEFVAASTSDDELKARVHAGDLYGYLRIPETAAQVGGEGCLLVRQDSQLEVGQVIERIVNDAVFALRCEQSGLDPVRVAVLRAPVEVRWATTSRDGEEVAVNPMLQLMTPFVFMLVLFIGVFNISQQLLTTLIEEKSSRVVEMLLASVSPTQLLAGKILGMASVGFLLVAVWSGAGMLAAQKYGVSELVDGYRLTMAVIYFVPGFLLFASILGAIGSACNELKEAQSMVFPLSLMTFVPLMFWLYITQHPTAAFSLLLSYLPPMTPFVMILRVCADPQTPWWQIATTQAVLWASVIAAIWAAGKIFRVGVLMYGKPPSLAELLRWVRAA